jgi:hypothetical protein
MKITVNVTQEDINRGVRQNGERCPVALALIRALALASGELIIRPTIALSSGFVCANVLGFDRHHDYPIPGAARDFIQKFDRGLHVEPFTFEFEFDLAPLAA